jgi:hypothetical protein
MKSDRWGLKVGKKLVAVRNLGLVCSSFKVIELCLVTVIKWYVLLVATAINSHQFLPAKLNQYKSSR